ncbi:valine--tRNA ligase, partial [Dispira parvispora]
NFWLYELCDVYIEAIKPVCDADEAVMENLKRKTAAQNTLYTCLDWGVRLLHPFMPFITEELFQRLPRRPGSALESIITAPFPEFVPEFYDERAEADFDLMFAVARNVRSLMADYNITSQAQAYLTADNDATRELLAGHTATIRTLIKGCQAIDVIGADQHLPAGCVPAAVNQNCHVLLLVKGKVNIEAEVDRLEKKLTKARQQLGTWEKKTQIPDYETKIKADVREVNATKIKGYQAEIDALSHSLQNFLALED